MDEGCLQPCWETGKKGVRGWLGLFHVEKDLSQGRLPCLPGTDLLPRALGVPGLASPGRKRCLCAVSLVLPFWYILTARLSGPCLPPCHTSCPVPHSPCLLRPHALLTLASSCSQAPGFGRALLHLPTQPPSAVCILPMALCREVLGTG